MITTMARRLAIVALGITGAALAAPGLALAQAPAQTTQPPGPTQAQAQAQIQNLPNTPAKMTFFVSSAGMGKGGNLGGLAGADAFCTKLATSAGAPPSRKWHAYLSQAPINGLPQIDARNRIGKGPWYNAKGVEIAANVEELHGLNPKMTKLTNLTEQGIVNNGGPVSGDKPAMHDILTGSDKDGRLKSPEVAEGRAGAPALPLPPNMTCNNWTSDDHQLSTEVGHADRAGFVPDAKSFNAAHPSRGCDQPGIVSTGGAGQIYCFSFS
jgi:hypothetical protein